MISLTAGFADLDGPLGLGNNPKSELAIEAFAGNDAKVAQLLMSGFSVNETNEADGMTPLMYAAMAARTSTVKLLIDAGADVTQVDLKGRNSLHIAIEHFSPLFDQAPSPENLQLIRYLLELGIDVNTQNGSGDSALILASKKGIVPFVEILIAFGAATDISNYSGLSPLMLAAEGKHLEVVQILIFAGADVNAVDEGGVSVLVRAAGDGGTETVEFLAASGADVNAVDNNGNTALMAAVVGRQWLNEAARIETVNALLHAGADPNTANPGGSTPLSQAQQNKHSELAQILMSSGAYQ